MECKLSSLLPSLSPSKVPRDYNAFEKFQRDVLDAFPELKLPDLPRKFHLFVNQSDIEERQVAFDCLMKVVAQKRELCSSVPVLRFLGKQAFIVQVTISVY